MSEYEENDERYFLIPSNMAGERLDRVLVGLCTDLSRARIQNLIEEQDVLVNNVPAKSSYRVAEGDEVSMNVPPAFDDTPTPEDIPLDIIFEDDDVVLVNKPAGMVVHPAAGHGAGTLVNAVLYHCGDTLSGINGVKRPGIVHRLDKDTSGLIMVAKNDAAHNALAAQLQDRTLSRRYTALVLGCLMPPVVTITTQMGRHGTNRLKQSVLHRGGREAITHVKSMQCFAGQFSLVECHLKTGRTHQIRVHMEHIKHPIIGDPLYGPQNNAVTASAKRLGLEDADQQRLINFPRQALHAAFLSFVHPSTGEQMEFHAPLPEDMAELIKTFSLKTA
jgi:23S rRNA pseudouridine1911/1915/1917 synthase